MPRAGRSLELLVHALEQVLAETPVEIRSPDYIIGKVTHTRREVDVSLRSHIGSVEVLVIIECRDRSKTQDVTWVEQLASKREDVGADKAVAVSATGFSPGARNLAQSKQIELRSFEELGADIFFDWLDAQTVEHRTRRVDVVGVSIGLADRETKIDAAKLASMLRSIDQLRIPQEGVRRDDKLFVHKADLTMVSIDDILTMMPAFGVRFDARFIDLPPNEKRRTILTIGFKGKSEFAVPVPSGLIDIDSISIDGHFYYDEILLPIRRYLYRAEAGTIAENAAVTIESGASSVTLNFYANSGGSVCGFSVSSTGDPLPGGMDLSFDLRQIGDQSLFLKRPRHRLDGVPS